MAPNMRAAVPGIAFVKEREGISEYRLTKNGLQILLAPDPAQPVAGVMVTYHVGSRNEASGYTGSTHLLEHLLFKGSRRFNGKNTIQDMLETKGALVNASTSYDRTNYYEVVPSELVPLALEIEADRMRNAFIREKDRRSEMTVVRNEFEWFEDDPYTVLDRLMFGIAFQSHPYHNPIIGWREDIENVAIERLQRFYDDFYWPDNATLTIAGNFDTPKTLRHIKKEFGTYTKKPEPYPSMYSHEPMQEGQRRGVVRRAGKNIVGIGYRMPAARHPDMAALAILGTILTQGKTARLHKALVEMGHAVGVGSRTAGFVDPGLFQIFVTLTEKSDHQEVEGVLLQALRTVQKKGITSRELHRAKVSMRTSLASRRDGLYSFLDAFNDEIAVHDWEGFFTEPDLFAQITVDDVTRVAHMYLVEDQSTIGWYVRTDHDE